MSSHTFYGKSWLCWKRASAGGGYIPDWSDWKSSWAFCDLLHSVGEQISQQVFTDNIQLLFDEKSWQNEKGNLSLATATDSVLGVNAAQIQSGCWRKFYNKLIEKGKLIYEISKVLIESIESAQLLASHFETDVLWFLAFVDCHLRNNP